MQHMAQPPPNPLMNAIAPCSAIAALLTTVFFAPEVYAQSKGFVIKIIIENYGYDYATWGEIGWAVLCALLLFSLVNFVLQSLVMIVAIALAKIFI